MAQAPVEDQARLLAVQELDSALLDLHYRRTHIDKAERRAAAIAEAERVSDHIETLRAAVGDIQREVDQVEGDIDQARSRLAHDEERSDSGKAPARELAAIHSEMEALRRRIGALEDAELEVLERHEQAEKRVAEAEQSAHVLTDTIDELTAAVSRIEAEIDAESQHARANRETAAQGIDADLLALYDKLRAQHGGVGAAALERRRCTGCNMELNPGDLQELRGKAPEDIVRCEECGRILVRGEGSGL